MTEKFSHLPKVDATWRLKPPAPLLLSICLYTYAMIGNNRSLHRLFNFFGCFIDGPDHGNGDLDGQGKNQL